ncbi:von Willebrand factor A domain-containing protein 5A-like isoform X2 [Petromyzon marinus]|uniref:von Willebrand factor A domain-containing protein 5A-like isoform X2 n=1 Tax=Petromyzon marinus TaxID=7757 RepID=UPI003F70BDAF
MHRGLVYHHEHEERVVPLRSVAVKALVQGFVADVVASMIYHNKEAFPVEPSYFFPLNDNSAVHAFCARVGDREIVAAVKEKSEAVEEYDDAIAKGHMAAQLSQQCGDVFHCVLGNLGAGEEAEVTLEFVSELDVGPDGAVRFCLPTVLNPRYSPQGSMITWEYLAPSQNVPYTLSFTLTAENPGGILDVSSPSDLLGPVAFTEPGKTSAQVSLEGDFRFDHDIEVLISYEQKHQPFALVEPGLPVAEVSFLADTVAMLNFFPGDMEQTAVPTSEHGEFIFIIDCSGSMRGQPIASAKETLILLIKSLPMGCLFNIYRFGTRYISLFGESTPYNQQTIEAALAHVKRADADMGGTNILEPLADIYRQPCKPEHPRKLFLLTDEMVMNTEGVIQKVKNHSMDHRCFAFGIGQGVSTQLIKEVARVGNGLSEFVTSSDQLQAKVLRMLKCAMQPLLGNPQLEWSLPPGVTVTVVPTLPRSIFMGQKMIVYAQFTGTPPAAPWQGEALLKYSLCGKPAENRIVFTCEPDDRKDQLVLHRLMAKALTRHPRAAGGPSDDARQSAVALSIEAGIVSPYTAFVAVDNSPRPPIADPMQARPVPLPYPRSAMVYHATRDFMPVDFSHHRHGPWMDFLDKSLWYNARVTSPDADCDSASCSQTSSSTSEPSSMTSRQAWYKARVTSPDAGYDSASSSRSSTSKTSSKTSRWALFKARVTSPDTGYDSRSSSLASTSETSSETSPASPGSELCLKRRKSCMPRISSLSLEKRYRTGSQEMSPTSPSWCSITRPACTQMDQLVYLQQADGSWKSLEQLAAVVQMPLENLQSEAPKGMASEVWATVLALVWLQSEAAEQKLKWDLLARKASLWLSQQEATWPHIIAQRSGFITWTFIATK